LHTNSWKIETSRFTSLLLKPGSESKKHEFEIIGNLSWFLYCLYIHIRLCPSVNMRTASSSSSAYIASTASPFMGLKSASSSSSHHHNFQMSGLLKQQTLDSTGYYDWVIKHFVLDADNNELHVSSTPPSDDPGNAHTDTEAIKISLSGAKHAKEWAYSSAIAGYGFDIVWSSGKIWSFLADTESVCIQWVTALNSSINKHSLQQTHTPDVFDRTALPQYQQNRVNASTLPPQPPTVDLNRHTHGTHTHTSGYTMGNKHTHASTASVTSTSAAAPFGVNVSSIHGGSSADTSPDSNDSNTQSHTLHTHMSTTSNVMDNMYVPTQLFPAHTQGGSSSSADIAKEYESLRTRYQQLSDMMMELQTQRQTESELANMKITTLGNRIVDLERDVYSVNELAKQTQVIRLFACLCRHC
jgi:hypothetical protein